MALLGTLFRTAAIPVLLLLYEKRALLLCFLGSLGAQGCEYLVVKLDFLLIHDKFVLRHEFINHLLLHADELLHRDGCILCTDGGPRNVCVGHHARSEGTADGCLTRV
jgi:hypothetical protein